MIKSYSIPQWEHVPFPYPTHDILRIRFRLPLQEPSPNRNGHFCHKEHVWKEEASSQEPTTRRYGSHEGLSLSSTLVILFWNMKKQTPRSLAHPVKFFQLKWYGVNQMWSRSSHLSFNRMLLVNWRTNFVILLLLYHPMTRSIIVHW